MHLSIRLQLIKKHFLFFIGLIVLPIVGTWLTVQLIAQQEELTIPIAVIDLDQTQESKRLIRQLKEGPYFQLIEVNDTQIESAILTQQIDSSFTIQQGFEEQIKKGARDRVIESSYSNLSFAYPIAKEMIQSLVQTRALLYQIHSESEALIQQPILLTTMEKDVAIIKEQQQLLTVSFNHGATQQQTNTNIPLLLFGFFSFFSIISYSLQFVQENQAGLHFRLPFIYSSIERYFIMQSVVVTSLFVIIYSMIVAFQYTIDYLISYLFLWLTAALTGYFLLLWSKTTKQFVSGTTFLLFVCMSTFFLPSHTLQPWHPLVAFQQQTLAFGYIAILIAIGLGGKWFVKSRTSFSSLP